MGKVVISSADRASVRAFPALGGLSARGAVESRGVIDAPDRPLLFWHHTLAPGAELCWEAPPVGHVVYVWEGDADVDGALLDRDCALVVEHNGNALLRAGSKGATLAHFHQREGGSESPPRAGGNTHVVGRQGIFRGHNQAIDREVTHFADSTCPTCALWLHKNHLRTANPSLGRHYHLEDEIIVVREGAMLLGRRTLPPGTALAIDANTIYTFGIRPEGLAFLNFRTTEPRYVKVGPDNKPLHAPVGSREMARDPRMSALAGGRSVSAESYENLGLTVPAPAKEP